jgi:hypothetical protein
VRRYELVNAASVRRARERDEPAIPAVPALARSKEKPRRQRAWSMLERGKLR